MRKRIQFVWLFMATFIAMIALSGCWDETTINNTINVDDDTELEEIAQIVALQGEEALTVEQRIKWYEHLEAIEEMEE